MAKLGGRKSASWVLVDRKSGRAVMETFVETTALSADRDRYEVFPILEWLQRVNVAARSPSPTPGEA